MNRLAPRTYRIAAVVLLASIATLAGAWWGYEAAQTSAPAITAPATTVKVLPPDMPLPPPLFRAEAPEPVATLGGTPNTLGNAAATPVEIFPAGVGSQSLPTDLLWETTANQPWQVRPQPITPPNWYITGVVRRGEQTQVIVQFDGEPMPRMFKVGDTLPGGARLGWVRPNAIGVITPSKKALDVPVLGGDPASRQKPISPPPRNAPPPISR